MRDSSNASQLGQIRPLSHLPISTSNLFGRRKLQGALIFRSAWMPLRSLHRQGRAVTIRQSDRPAPSARKSREFRRHVASPSYISVPVGLLVCSPHHQASALYPFISQLEHAAGIERDDTPERKLERLEELLARASRDSARDIALLADLLSIPSGSRYPLPGLSPQKRKEETLIALLAQLDGLAAREPVLMIFEDAHWIDPTSLELLERIIDRIQGPPEGEATPNGGPRPPMPRRRRPFGADWVSVATNSGRVVASCGDCGKRGSFVMGAVRGAIPLGLRRAAQQPSLA
jgi:hypothetical protein